MALAERPGARKQDSRQTWINGVAVEDLERDEFPRSGFIGLQVHGIKAGKGPFEVRWQNIFVKDLSSQHDSFTPEH